MGFPQLVTIAMTAMTWPMAFRSTLCENAPIFVQISWRNHSAPLYRRAREVRPRPISGSLPA